MGRQAGSEERPGERVAAEAQDIGEEALYRERERETERRVAWAEEFKGLEHRLQRRAVVLAPPGQGKSLLTQMTARDLARQAWEALDTQRMGVGDVPLPIVVALNALTDKGLRTSETPEEWLRRAVATALRETDCPEVAGRYLAEHAHEDRSWLFLDALDETEDDEALARLFGALTQWQCNVIITSRPYGYEARRLPFDVTEYRLAPFSAGQQREFVAKRFDESETQSRVSDLLARSPSVRHVGQNPFLLTLLCWVAERHDLSPDITRTELYDHVLHDLLGLPLGGTGDVDEQRAEEWLPLLTQVAFTFFQDSAGRRPIPSGRLLKMTARSGLRPVPLDEQGHRMGISTLRNLTPVQQADYLIEELCRKRVLVPLTRDRGAYVVPHRSFLEYLTACWLTERINSPEGKQWKSRIQVASRRGTVLEFVDRKAWHPDWEQVITFLAGRLADPAPLLRILGDPKPTPTNTNGDDHFRHRLGLAALCLAELQSTTLSQCTATVDDITTAAFSLWQDHHRSHTVASVPHIAHALPSLALANGRVAGTPLLGRLCQMLRSGGDAGWEVEEALREMCEAAARHSDVLPALLAALHGSDSDMREHAVAGLGNIGEAAARHPGVLPALLAALHDTYSHVRWCAAEALGEMGEAAARHPDVLPALVATLHDKDSSVVGKSAAYALGGMGEAAVRHPDVLAALLAALHDTDSGVRRCAACALVAMGKAAVRHPDVLPALLAALHDMDSGVRMHAARALRVMGEAEVQHPDFLPTLEAALHDTDLRVRWYAAAALGKMGEAAAQYPGILPALVATLHDKDSDVRRDAAKALGKVGEAAARHPDVIAALLAAMHDTDSDVRHYATEALGEMGEAAAQYPGVLPALVATLHDTHSHARWCAIGALRNMGEAAARHPNVIAALLAAMHDTDSDVCNYATEALWKMGEAAARHPDVLPTLVEAALHDTDSDLDVYAAGALGGMGDAAVRHPDVLPTLVAALHNKDSSVRQCAARALAEMGAAAAQYPGILPALVATLHDTDSGVCRRAADALGRMGEAAARHPDVLPALLAALHDMDSDMRPNAASALGKMGEAAARHPDVLAALLEALHDTDKHVRRIAAEALGQMGEAAAQYPGILPALVATLHDKDSDVRRDAAEALGEMGEAAARHAEVLPALLAALHDTDSYVRWRAAMALGQIMALGMRVFQDAPGRWYVRTVAELSRWQRTPAGPRPQAPRDGP